MGDADNTYDFCRFPRSLHPLNNGADFVIGSRFKGTIHPGSMTSLHRYIGNPLLTWMINHIFHTRFTDTHSGFRAITREALDRLNLKTGGMEFASEMLVMASKEGLRIEEVPIDYYPRAYAVKTAQFCGRLAAYPVRASHETPPVPCRTWPLFSLVGLLLMAFFALKGNVESSHLHTFILGAIMMMGGIAGNPDRIFNEDLFGHPRV